MAGLLYLPRLYVYHATVPVGSDRSATFKVMERRLLRGIMNPAMVATYLFGILLAATPGVVDWARGWIYIKLVAVAAVAAGLRRRREPASGTAVSHGQRSSGRAADPHRHHGGGEAVLNSGDAFQMSPN